MLAPPHSPQLSSSGPILNLQSASVIFELSTLQIAENLASPASPRTLSSEIEQSLRGDGSSRNLSDAVRHDSLLEHQTPDIEGSFERQRHRSGWQPGPPRY